MCSEINDEKKGNNKKFLQKSNVLVTTKSCVNKPQ